MKARCAFHRKIRPPVLPLRASLLVGLLAWALAAVPAAAPAQDAATSSPMEAIEPLARLIGAAHQLRQQCDSSDFTWREQMLTLIDIEGQGNNRREQRLIDAFNAGFRDQERIRVACGAEASRAEAELAVEGRRLAEDLRDRYLN